ncbi:unnamed protein product [Mytilus coruscus]|uniref:Uncharacterized protein n=1 Tax=Mytilus coruscus TaxID=42192 RepID=A0A6J7ZYG4_MYTCO|nr:unnamed protein product [Mytilus coruscus]
MIEIFLVDQEGGVYNDGHMMPHNSSAKSVKSCTSRDVTIDTTSRRSRDENKDTSGQPDLYQMMIQTEIMMQKAMKNREEVDLNTDLSESGDDSDQEDVGKLCEVADNVQLDACTADMPEDDDDFMQSLGDFLSSEDKQGPKISNSLAGIVNTGMKQKVSEDKIKSMLKKEKASPEEQLQEERQALNPVDMECESFEHVSSQTDLKFHAFTFMNTPDNFIVGKICKFLGCWKLPTQDNWILSMVKGYKIEFDTVPQQTKLP